MTTEYVYKYLADDTKVLLLDEFVQPDGIHSFVVKKLDTPGCFVVDQVFNEVRAERMTEELKAIQLQIAEAKKDLKELENFRRESEHVRQVIQQNPGLHSAALFMSGRANWAVSLGGYNDNLRFAEILTIDALFGKVSGSVPNDKSKLHLLNLQIDVNEALKKGYQKAWMNQRIYAIVNGNHDISETFVFAETYEEAQAIAQEYHDKEMKALSESKSDLSWAYDKCISRHKSFGIQTDVKVMAIFIQRKRDEIKKQIQKLTESNDRNKNDLAHCENQLALLPEDSQS
jgi:hypothetical protein